VTQQDSDNVASSKLPVWAKRLMDRHPGASLPTDDDPLPSWLEEEIRRAPLWLHIRGSADDPRWAPPYHLIEDVQAEPSLLADTLNLRDQINALAASYIEQGVTSIIFSGAGSALYSSILAAFFFSELLEETSSEAVEAWEFCCYPRASRGKSLFVAQSATGGSFEVVKAARLARDMGMSTLAITNTPDSPLEAVSEQSIVMPAPQKAGPDISVIPTRLMIVYMLGLAWAERSKSRRDDLQDLNRQLQLVPELAQKLIDTSQDKMAEISKKRFDQQVLLTVGGGPNWFSALEAGLKIEEESSTPCRAYTPGDFHHMAISLLGPSRTVMAFAFPGPSYERCLTCLKTASTAGSPTIVVALENDKGARAQAEDAILIPGSPNELLVAPLTTIVGQLLGYHLGLAKGRNPDCLGTDDLAHARAWLTSFPFGTH
jgi:glucosamine--fructose-6-phosphate aminotransferase (isomerizing)